MTETDRIILICVVLCMWIVFSGMLWFMSDEFDGDEYLSFKHWLRWPLMLWEIIETVCDTGSLEEDRNE